jgi:hypothetical protein
LFVIELVSVPALLARPRYPWSDDSGSYFDQGTWWEWCDETALAALCAAGASLQKSAYALGRAPTTLAHRASDTGLKLPREWREAITKRRAANPRGPLLQYPFISAARGEHAEILAVNALIPRGLPDYERADIIQEIMLALLEKRFTLAEMRDPRIVRQFIKGFRSSNFEDCGYALSLDAPMRDGRSWYDVLPASNPDEAFA